MIIEFENGSTITETSIKHYKEAVVLTPQNAHQILEKLGYGEKDCEEFNKYLSIELEQAKKYGLITPKGIEYGELCAKNNTFPFGSYYVDFDCSPPLRCMLYREEFEKEFGEAFNDR